MIKVLQKLKVFYLDHFRHPFSRLSTLVVTSSSSSSSSSSSMSTIVGDPSVPNHLRFDVYYSVSRTIYDVEFSNDEAYLDGLGFMNCDEIGCFVDPDAHRGGSTLRRSNAIRNVNRYIDFAPNTKKGRKKRTKEERRRAYA